MGRSKLLARTFKLQFGLKLCLLTIAGMGAVTLFLYLMTSRSLGASYSEAIYTIYDLKIRIFPLVFASFYSVFILVVFTAAMAAISMLFSHKIAGPVFRIEKNLELIGSGDLTVQTRFRGNDQLMALAEEINAMTRSLNHMARSSGEALSRIEECEARLEEIVGKDCFDEKAALEAVRGLRAGIEELKRAASSLATEK